MDPLSITAAVASLIFTCAKVTKCFQAVKSTYSSAPTTITSMTSECAVISTALSQIQSLVLKDPIILSSHLSSQNSLQTCFENVLTGCTLTMSVIEEEIGKLIEGEQGMGTVGFKAKVKFIWKEDMMVDLLQQIRGQQSALSLLTTVLQT
jgi:hypothetical protein